MKFNELMDSPKTGLPIIIVAVILVFLVLPWIVYSFSEYGDWVLGFFQ